MATRKNGRYGSRPPSRFSNARKCGFDRERGLTFFVLPRRWIFGVFHPSNAAVSHSKYLVSWRSVGGGLCVGATMKMNTTPSKAERRKSILAARATSVTDHVSFGRPTCRTQSRHGRRKCLLLRSINSAAFLFYGVGEQLNHVHLSRTHPEELQWRNSFPFSIFVPVVDPPGATVHKPRPLSRVLCSYLTGINVQQCQY